MSFTVERQVQAINAEMEMNRLGEARPALLILPTSAVVEIAASFQRLSGSAADAAVAV
ncbi:MAG TPA: hypothetical protein VGD67_11455 [Pseudonocardiaceae bacterium]